MSRLVILHTNDMHNVLARDEQRAARLMEIVEAERANPPVLLLDAGDAIGAGNLTFNPAGEAILERMTAIGYHAMTIGNREFHLTEIGFTTKLNRARFPVLCANVRPRGDARLPVRSHTVLETPVGRVGVFGVTVPMITERMLSHRVSAYVFDDPIRVGAEMAERLRPQVDLLIALTHIGLKQDIELAKRAPQIDLIIGGHSHSVLEEPQREGRVAIVQAGSYARFVGRVEVEFAEQTTISGKLLLLV